MICRGYNFGEMYLVWWSIWIFIILIFIGLFISSSKKKIREDSPLDILMKRFASGEITNEEYLKKKKIIEKDRKESSA